MSDELFRRIRESSGKQELPPYHDSAWEAYEDYANKKDRPKGLPWYAWGIGSLMFLLVLSNIFWWSKTSSLKSSNSITDSIITHGENTIQTDLKSVSYTQAQLDSVIFLGTQKAVNNQQKSIDELIANVNQLQGQIVKLILEKDQLNSKFASPGVSNSRDIYSAKSSEGLFNTTLLGDAKAIGLTSLNGQTPQNAFVSGLVVSEDNKSNTSILGSDDLGSSTLGSNTLGSTTIVTRLPRLRTSPFRPLAYDLPAPTVPFYIITIPTSNNNPLDFIRPKSLSILFQGGYSGIVESELGYSSGLSLGVGLSTAFSRHIRMSVRVQMMSTTAEIDLKGDQNLSLLRDVLLPVGSRAKELYYDYESKGISIGMDYMFTPKGRVRPYIGFMYSMQFAQIKNQFLEYEVNNQSSVQLLPQRGLPKTQFIGIQGGLDLNLFEDIDASLNLSIQKNINNESLLLLNISPGVKYHF